LLSKDDKNEWDLVVIAERFVSARAHRDKIKCKLVQVDWVSFCDGHLVESRQAHGVDAFKRLWMGLLHAHLWPVHYIEVGGGKRSGVSFTARQAAG
jgi:hypothetical protein